MSRKPGIRTTIKTDFDPKQIKQIMDSVLVEYVNRVTTRLQQSIKVTLSKPGSGNKWPGLTYTSAAAGQPPTIQTGRLRGSWVTQAARSPVKKTKNGVKLSLGTDVRYAKILDLGSHPFIGPALETGRFRRSVKKETDRLERKTREAIANSSKKRKVVK